jgi:hypothetical protein
MNDSVVPISVRAGFKAGRTESAGVGALVILALVGVTRSLVTEGIAAYVADVVADVAGDGGIWADGDRAVVAAVPSVCWLLKRCVCEVQERGEERVVADCFWHCKVNLLVLLLVLLCVMLVVVVVVLLLVMLLLLVVRLQLVRLLRVMREGLVMEVMVLLLGLGLGLGLSLVVGGILCLGSKVEQVARGDGGHVDVVG